MNDPNYQEVRLLWLQVTLRDFQGLPARFRGAEEQVAGRRWLS